MYVAGVIAMNSSLAPSDCRYVSFLFVTQDEKINTADRTQIGNFIELMTI